MKKYLTLCLLLLCIIMATMAYAESNDSPFTPTRTNNLYTSPRELFESADSRAMFSARLATDYSNQDPGFDVESLLRYPSYVAYMADVGSLILGVMQGDTAYMIFYSSPKQEALCSVISPASPLAFEYAFDVYGYPYYENTHDSLAFYMGF